MTDECLIRIEIRGELVISAEVSFDEGKSGALFGKSDLSDREKAAICRGLRSVAFFVGCPGQGE